MLLMTKVFIVMAIPLQRPLGPVLIPLPQIPVGQMWSAQPGAAWISHGATKMVVCQYLKTVKIIAVIKI